MDVNKIKRKERPKRKVSINIRISEDVSKWMKEKNYSPTAIFNEAVKELGFKEETK